MAYGETVVLAAMLTMLATMDIVKATDEEGNEITVDPGTTGKLTKYVRYLNLGII